MIKTQQGRFKLQSLRFSSLVFLHNALWCLSVIQRQSQCHTSLLASASYIIKALQVCSAPFLAFLSAMIFMVEIFENLRCKCHRKCDKLVSDGAAVITRRLGAIKRIRREPSGPLHPAIASFMEVREIWEGAVSVAAQRCCNIALHDEKINEKWPAAHSPFALEYFSPHHKIGYKNCIYCVHINEVVWQCASPSTIKESRQCIATWCDTM